MAILAIMTTACSSPAERAAKALAERIVPGYASAIEFREVPATNFREVPATNFREVPATNFQEVPATNFLEVPATSFREVPEEAEGDFYEIQPVKGGIVIKGNNANSLAAGLGRYLEEAGIDVSWYASQAVEYPADMPVPDSTIRCSALVPQRFFLNYCTFGYTMPWWKWEEWERLIDWMALHGVNLPLAITGQEAVWQKVWRKYGLTDDEIRAYFTGPAHLPWHRMCNIDGVDGPLPQKWIDRQARLQKKILARERALGMKPVLPAFGGHVPRRLTELYPDATITPVSIWCEFPEANRTFFLRPSDPLYAAIQKDFLTEQKRLFGTDHIYGFDLFNEVQAPSWDPATLSEIGRDAYGSLAAADPDAQWLQMGWMFFNDRRHWTPENVKAYLEAVPQGKVTILDYYVERMPIWTLTESFFGQPFIFCYLGNFGGNTRLAGPFKTMSDRITEALDNGGATGLGCTLEGFGINRWFYEYTLGRAWEFDDDGFFERLDRRHHSPAGFWKDMADSVYLRSSASEGPLMCDFPTPQGHYSWKVPHRIPYKMEVLERQWSRLLEHGGNSTIWKADIAEIGCQVLGNRFPALRDSFVAACRAGDYELGRTIGDEMIDLMMQADSLAGTHPQMRIDRWITDAESWGDTPQEKEYYRRNAWHLVTTWGYNPHLDDYASRLWNGLTSMYYVPRWKMFIDRMLEGDFDYSSFENDCWNWEVAFVDAAPEVTTK